MLKNNPENILLLSTIKTVPNIIHMKSTQKIKYENKTGIVIKK